MNIKEIKAPVQAHVDAFEKIFNEAIKSRVPLLDIITRYIVKRKGKQIRPLFVFFAAGLCGDIQPRSHRAATLIEMLHTATLIHDDVVDDSNERRGFFSLNALWKNKISVLVGDYLLSRGLLLSLNHDDFDLLKIVSHSVREMSEGELLQMEKARKLDIREDVYFDIIRKKTASLIASCTHAGAASVGADAQTCEKLRQIGEYVGIAFQIKDDLLDYNSGNNTGKPCGVDIRERKMTLPLIYMLQQSSFLEKRKIIYMVKNHNHNPQKVTQLMDMVNQSGGVAYARAQMEAYKNQALELLMTLPHNSYRDYMANLIRFAIEREN